MASGGAGNRTLVRVWFRNRIYVRRSLFQRLPEPARNRPFRGLPPEVSPRASEDHAQPARICDPILCAPGGLSEPEVRQASFSAQLTQPAPGYRWRLVVSKWFSQGPGPGHAAIPSSNPSKPIAPGCVIMIHVSYRPGNLPPDRPEIGSPPHPRQSRKHESTKHTCQFRAFVLSCFRGFSAPARGPSPSRPTSRAAAPDTRARTPSAPHPRGRYQAARRCGSTAGSG
jgi:hypothetical protein